ncbi:AAEL001956-PA [Aedes aegypti]|uniref:AAEL001956-PA n=1 Tax=Aedes aegypti TaxID=7159 RepID=Q17JN8_AEDAE|nr:AAEL001956-PA [Aedes aegypti]
MLNQGEMAVTAPKFRDQILWHPRCFKCTTCDELLVDLTYCVHDDQIYCERHYAELLKPRCNACDELSSICACYRLAISFVLDIIPWDDDRSFINQNKHMLGDKNRAYLEGFRVGSN